MIAAHPSDELSSAFWVDLREPTDEELARVAKATGLRIPTQAQVSEIEASSRLAFENGAFYCTTPLVSAESGVVSVTQVGFVLSPKVLVTVRYAGADSFDAVHEAIAKDERRGSPEETLLELLEVIVDRYADALEREGAQSDELAASAFRPARGKAGHRLREVLSSIGHVAGHTSRIRDALLGLGRVTAFVAESTFDGAPKPNAARLKAIRADVASLTDYEGHLSTKIQFLLDATLGFVNIEQNEIVKTLTIASVVGIPPVLLAGIWGMNFHAMPELSWPWGYPVALLAIFVSALVPLAWFKWRGWM